MQQIRAREVKRTVLLPPNTCTSNMHGLYLMRLFYNYFTLQVTDIYLPLLVARPVYFAPDAVSSSPMHTSVPAMFHVSLYTFMCSNY